MAYRMDYAPILPRKKGASHIRRCILTGVCFVCFCIGVCRFWPEGRQLLQLLLIPGDPTSTLEAAETFARELGCGQPLSAAAEHFYMAVSAP